MCEDYIYRNVTLSQYAIILFMKWPASLRRLQLKLCRMHNLSFLYPCLSTPLIRSISSWPEIVLIGISSFCFCLGISSTLYLIYITKYLEKMASSVSSTEDNENRLFKFKVSHMMTVTNVASLLAGRQRLVSRSLTCADDPQSTSFQVGMGQLN